MPKILGLGALCLASLAPVFATQIVIDGTPGVDCVNVVAGGNCGISYQIYPNPPQTKPPDWILDSISISLDLTVTGGTSDFALGLEQDPLLHLFFPISGSLSSGLNSLSAGPYTQGAVGQPPGFYGGPATLDFTQTDWNNPPSNGVLPGVLFNDGSVTFSLTGTPTLTINYHLASPVPEPGTMGLICAGLLAGLWRRRRFAR